MNRRNFLRSSIAAGVGAALPISHLYAAFDPQSDMPAVLVGRSGDGGETALPMSSVKDLAASLRGSVLLAGDSGYDEARRVLNRGIDKHPALVVQPIGVTDIRRAVDFARDNDLLLAVKCGGHSYAGKSTVDGGLQIDLSTFRHARVRPNGKTIDVAGGSLLGEIDREAMQFGKATTAGTVSHTGVGGLTTGGGFGRLARRFGLALDNVVSVDVVTADGRLVHADAEQNEDLYWGVRGGGGNFGIVTNFEFALHPVEKQVIAGEVMFPVTRFREVLALYADLIDSVPDELYLDCLASAPQDPSQAGAGFSLCWSGDPNRFEDVIAPIRKLGPVFDGLQSIAYVDEQRRWDDTDPRSESQYLKGGFVNELPPKLVQNLADGFAHDPGRSTMVYFQHSGGAIGRVPVDATAFAHRKSLANMMCITAWPLDADGASHIAWQRDYWNTLDPFTDGFYTNEISDEGERVVNANYQGNYDRLVRVKNKYDPTNLFRLNANIKPRV